LKKICQASEKVCFEVGRENIRAVVPEIIAWTIKNLRKPDIGITCFWVAFGQVGDAAVNFSSMGVQTTVKVVWIFEGERLGNIPIEEASFLKSPCKVYLSPSV